MQNCVFFLCSLDNFLLKKVIVFFLEIKCQNGTHLKKGLFLTYFSHYLVTRERHKISFPTYLTNIHTRILLTLLIFFALPILQKVTNLSCMVSLWRDPGIDSFFSPLHFGAINK